MVALLVLKEKVIIYCRVKFYSVTCKQKSQNKFKFIKFSFFVKLKDIHFLPKFLLYTVKPNVVFALQL